MNSKLTITREQATDKEIQMLIDSHENGTAMFLRVDAYYLMAKELQECRKAELDSKPVAWTDEEELRDANESGSGYLFGIGHDANKFADPRRQIMLYLHAQPAPVVPDVMEPTIEAIKRILPTSNPDEYAACIGADMWNACRAAMLQAGNPAAWWQGLYGEIKDRGQRSTHDFTPDLGMSTEDIIDAINKRHVSDAGNSPGITGAEQRIADAVELLKQAAPAMLADNNGPNGPLVGRLKSPVIPDGYRLQPISEYEAMCATVNSEEWPQRWIPVSERMPEVGVKVLCFPVKDEPIHATFNGQLWLQDISWSGSDEPIDNVIPTSVTHWMPMPATPQEVKSDINALIPLVSRNEQEVK